MKGLELSRKYYEEFAADALRAEFPQLMPYIAVGLCGPGSECMGYDDEVSLDHDLEPGFCIFIPGEDIVSRRDAFLLQRFYDKLPKEFEGLRRSLVSPAGGSRHGVIRTQDFLLARTGTQYLPLSTEQWLKIPEQSLLEATNGEIWLDEKGDISAMREYLSEMPEDIRLKKLASYLLLAAQSGQYNYARCLAHGEKGAAGLAAAEFVSSALHALMLLHGRYTPYYKWAFRALRECEPVAADRLEDILSGERADRAAGQTCGRTGEADPSDRRPAADTAELIEEVSSYIISMLQAQKITKATCGDLEKHAYSVNDMIGDSFLRNAGIFEGLNG